MICTDCYKSFEGVGVVCPNCLKKRAASGEGYAQGPNQRGFGRPSSANFGQAPEFERMSPAMSGGQRYYPIAVSNFLVLSILTGGIFSFYWFYRCWKYIKQRDGSRIWPFTRALFSPFSCYSLLKEIENDHQEGGAGAYGLAGNVWLGFFTISLTWKLPAPFCVLVSLGPLMLVPLVQAVNRINAPAYIAANSGLSIPRALLGLILGPFAILGIFSEINLLPCTEIVSGWVVWPHQRRVLEAKGCAAPGETLEIVYSHAMLNFEEHGVCITPRGVGTYETNPETGVETKRHVVWRDISNIEEEKSDIVFGDRTLRFAVRYGNSFTIELPEMMHRRTERTVEKIKSLWRKARA